MYDSLYNTLPSSLSERLDKSYAHSPGKPEKGARGGYHRLSEHIRGVVEKASRFGSKIGMEVEASLLAFFHDLGKVRPGLETAWCPPTRWHLPSTVRPTKVGLDLKSRPGLETSPLRSNGPRLVGPQEV